MRGPAGPCAGCARAQTWARGVGWGPLPGLQALARGILGRRRRLFLSDAYNAGGNSWVRGIQGWRKRACAAAGHAFQTRDCAAAGHAFQNTRMRGGWKCIPGRAGAQRLGKITGHAQVRRLGLNSRPLERAAAGDEFNAARMTAAGRGFLARPRECAAAGHGSQAARKCATTGLGFQAARLRGGWK